jgi:hypothetical protein
MRASRMTSVGTALLAILVLVGSSNVAEAATISVSGTTLTTFPGTCGEPIQTGGVGHLECVGLREVWAGDISGTAVFDEAVTLNFVSGRVGISGTATFIGSVGAVSGTLEWAYQGSGRLDLQTFAVLFIDGEERIIGASGGLSGAHGSITFSLIGEGPATYEGIIVL